MTDVVRDMGLFVCSFSIRVAWHGTWFGRLWNNMGRHGVSACGLLTIRMVAVLLSYKLEVRRESRNYVAIYHIHVWLFRSKRRYGMRVSEGSLNIEMLKIG